MVDRLREACLSNKQVELMGKHSLWKKFKEEKENDLMGLSTEELLNGKDSMLIAKLVDPEDIDKITLVGMKIISNDPEGFDSDQVLFAKAWLKENDPQE